MPDLTSSLNIFRLLGKYDAATSVDAYFLQMFLWERFRALFPKLVEFKAIKPKKVIVDGEQRENTSHYRPKGLRSSAVKATGKKTLSRVIDVEKNYSFLPNSTPLVKLFVDLFLFEQGGFDGAYSKVARHSCIRNWKRRKPLRATVYRGF